jgi:glycosyltransferase involved in cell wall biosynthesis
MLRRLYYTFKPYLPWRLRIGLRRIAARRKRAKYEAVWPIDESARRPPAGWPGWPEGKKFAFIITHDVEGPKGLARVRQLAELEIAQGFRSSFNLIPEGSYNVPSELRTWLTDHGFEVGVHDLEHDGKLYQSHRGFEKKAARINFYLRDWGAVGFRSGFMLRNLDWLHALDVRYDASTFDTDPFEPQSSGAQTIFPYWIPAPVSVEKVASPVLVLPSALSRPMPDPIVRGYIELPYTLPQDSTLFLVLGEVSPEIWIKKLDWIASHGGMALINIHPDYVRFEGEPTSRRTYPAAHYLRFLNHVRERYGDVFWHPLPREAAAFAKQLQPRPLLRRPRRVAMITHSFYETDNRVTRYAEALAARGDQVEVLALRRSPESPAEEIINGVRVSRIQYRFKKSEQSKFAYFWPMLRFLVSSSCRLTRRHARERYDVMHIHNMPDFLVFAAWFPKLTGVKIILDIHDIVPELYASKFGSGKRQRTMALLKWMERRSARFAHHIIVSNHLWLKMYASRTGTGDRCSVFINNVDTRVYRPHPRTRQDGKQLVIFPGGLQWHQGLDIALRAFQRVSRELPQAEFHIYGDGNMKPSLIALAAELGLEDRVRFFDPVPIAEIASIMANADLGVVPKRADSFGNQAYSTKIMEFMSLGVPVVVSKTEIDSYYFDDSVVRFFESGNVEALADAMVEVLRDAGLRQRMVTNASAYSERHSWDSRKGDYLKLVDSLS